MIDMKWQDSVEELKMKYDEGVPSLNLNHMKDDEPERHRNKEMKRNSSSDELKKKVINITWKFRVTFLPVQIIQKQAFTDENQAWHYVNPKMRKKKEYSKSYS